MYFVVFSTPFFAKVFLLDALVRFKASHWNKNRKITSNFNKTRVKKKEKVLRVQCGQVFIPPVFLFLRIFLHKQCILIFFHYFNLFWLHNPAMKTIHYLHIQTIFIAYFSCVEFVEPLVP